MKVISHNRVKKATKDFHCGGCEAILDYGSFEQFMDEFNLTEDERLSLMVAKQNKCRILRGEPYIKQFNADGGDAWTWRSIPRIYEICIKYNIFGD